MTIIMTLTVTWLIFQYIRYSVSITVNLTRSYSRVACHIPSTDIILVALGIDILFYKCRHISDLMDILQNIVTVLHAAGIYADGSIVEYSSEK